MPPPPLINPENEAESVAESIDLNSDHFDPPDQAAFYRRLAELVIKRRDELEAFIHGDDPPVQ